MTDSHEVRLNRARLSLDGLSTGDALGMGIELKFADHAAIIRKRKVPETRWRWTDDTNMALSIFSILRQVGYIDQDKLAANFARHFVRDRGYGSGARTLLQNILAGMPWQVASAGLFGTGSFGNGAAMRIPPLGAYFADDMPALIENARLSSEITHAHPEGIAGGIAVAAAAGYAWNLRGQPKPSRAEFIDLILPHIPDSEVKQNCLKARDLASGLDIEAIVDALGNGMKISAQDTVPFVLYNAAEYLDRYEEAIWQTLAGGGDADTTSAMVGGIVVLYTGEGSIPAKWLQHREPLPDWPFLETDERHA